MNTSRDLLAHLVRFDTTSRESNLALIDFMRTYLQDHGVACELVYNAHKSKAPTCWRPSAWPTCPASCCPGILMWCRWTASAGRWRRLN